MNTNKYEIRTMTKSEVKYAINSARKVGWNPGIHDGECFYTADPNGFFIGLLDGKPISCVSAVRYSNDYGFIGLLMVEEKYREKGYGYQIGMHALKYLEGVDIGIDGVDAMVETYEKYGFEKAYENARYEGKAAGSLAIKPDSRIVELSKVKFEDLLAYDATLFPAPRPKFLKCWITRPKTVSLGVVENNHLKGYSVLRKCFAGYKIGPLFAETEELAELLFQSLSSRIRKGTKIYLDVPGEKENQAATNLAWRHKMEKQFSTAHMYKMASGGKLNLPLDRWFGVTTFELG